MARAIYYDTETTGISHAKDYIIEIAAYDPDRGASFERFVKPPIPIPAEASAIHHITDEMVADASPFGVIAQELIDFCEGDVILIAHNNDAFDKLFLQSEFKRCGVEMPHWKYIDTLKWARRYRPDLPRHALQFLREVYEVEANNAHRALDDVIVMHKIFSKMFDDLSIDQVYGLLNVPRSLKHMPFGKHQGKLLEEVPKDYLKWLEESGAFEKASNQELVEALRALELV